MWVSSSRDCRRTADAILLRSIQNCDAEHFACQALEPDIESCQQQGKIMLISLGGGDQPTPWQFADKGQAEAFAKLLYNSFLGGNDPKVTRPFGKAVLDG